jgi:hypothetical protein
LRPRAAATSSLAPRLPLRHTLQFFKDIDGAYVANVRLYDPAVVDLAPKVCLWLRREERARAPAGSL